MYCYVTYTGSQEERLNESISKGTKILKTEDLKPFLKYGL